MVGNQDIRAHHVHFSHDPPRPKRPIGYRLRLWYRTRILRIPRPDWTFRPKTEIPAPINVANEQTPNDLNEKIDSEEEQKTNSNSE